MSRYLLLATSLFVIIAGCGPTGSGNGGSCVDADNDGHYVFDSADCLTGDDCDDGNADIYPGAPELPGDGVDCNCDGKDDPTDFTCADEAKDALSDYYPIANIQSHPGCSIETPNPEIRTAEEWYTPASIPGYHCAAKEYDFPAGVSEDLSKPIVLLVHGNSDMPLTWEACKNGTAGTPTCLHHDPMIAENLLSDGHRVYAVDMRFDRVCDPGPDTCDAEGNPARNMDHGWGVPIVQHFFQSVMEAFPDRDIAIVAHSFGATTSRDALRRLQCSGFNPWPRIKSMVFAAGGHHGVATHDYGWCETYAHTMKGTVVCEFGSRGAFSPTDFTRPLNGPSGEYEYPCQDGDSAFGISGLCQGNVPSLHTVVIEDVGDGTFVDEFVSEASSSLKNADNQTIAIDDIDTSGYFFRSLVGDGPEHFGFLKGHFGATRSSAAVNHILNWIQ